MKLCPACRNTYPDDYQTCPRDQALLVAVASEIVKGTVLRGKYEVLGELGAGGMATVYQVRHKAFHELAAIKVVHPHFMSDPSFVKRFRNEAVVARQLKHPNAVRIDDFDYTEDGRPFIVMEYVEGRSLYEMRKELSGSWPANRCIDIVGQAASALGAAHKLGIVHRDIKPSNILLMRASDGALRVKVLDFGIAKVSENHFAGMTSVLTQQSLIIGTPEYMSPEQAGGRVENAIDGRADIYSLGLVFYEMLTGAHPFQAETPMSMLIQQLHTMPAPPDSFAIPVSSALSALVLKSLQKDPNDRFQSAEEMLAAMKDPEAWYRTQAKPIPVRTQPATLADPAFTQPPARPAQPPPPVQHSRQENRELETPPAKLNRKSLVFALIAAVVLLAGIVFFYARKTASSSPKATQPTVPEVQPAQTNSPGTVAAPVSAAKVEALVASGNRSLANKDYDIASEFFEEALSLDPNNQEAKSGLQKASKAK